MRPAKASFANGLYGIVQPAERFAFCLHPIEGKRRVGHNQILKQELKEGSITENQYKNRVLNVVVDPLCFTGYRCDYTGVDHQFVIWRRGYTGLPIYFLEKGPNAQSHGQLTLGHEVLRRQWHTDLRIQVVEI